MPTVRFRRLGVPLLLAAGVAMAGCGEDDEGAGASTAPPPAQATTTAGHVADACGLLTDAEVAQQLGPGAKRERDAGTSIDELAYTQCRWTAGDNTIGIAVIATTARYETHRKLPRGEPVPGLGDAALSREGTSLETAGSTSGRTVTVKDGDRTLVVVLDAADAAETADVVPLARTALGRLRGTDDR